MLVLVCFGYFFKHSYLFFFISLLLTADAFPLFCSPYLRLDHFDGLIPFDFKTGPTDSNSKYLGESSVTRPLSVMHTRIFSPNFLDLLCFLLCRSLSVNLVSLELTYFCSGLLFAAVVQRRVWDYALTITLVHVAITSLGEQKPDRHSNTQNVSQIAGFVSTLQWCWSSPRSGSGGWL